jgi:hypothetical protein
MNSPLCPICDLKLTPHVFKGIACWRCKHADCPLTPICIRPEDDPPPDDDDDQAVFRMKIQPADGTEPGTYYVS